MILDLVLAFFAWKLSWDFPTDSAPAQILAGVAGGQVFMAFFPFLRQAGF